MALFNPRQQRLRQHKRKIVGITKKIKNSSGGMLNYGSFKTPSAELLRAKRKIAGVNARIKRAGN